MISYYFFGAQSFALSMCVAIKELYPACIVKGFLVTSLEGNPESLAGLPVEELALLSDRLSLEECQKVHILIATPENLHGEIINALKKYGFFNYTCLDSRLEARLMGMYYSKKGMKALSEQPVGAEDAKLQVYQAKFFKDVQLSKKYTLPEWMLPLQVGAALTTERVADFRDNSGENISEKNVNYCELTGLYWLWKKKLVQDDNVDYYGVFHYRRVLVLSEQDLKRLAENDIDVVLPWPTMHEPNIKSHHARYVKESDWQAMVQALQELQPEYAEAYEALFGGCYFYNYNIIVAKRKILKEYCEWLFPILERIEELSIPKGWERADRYIGYLGENLLTLYFLYHAKDFNIVHTGRLMLT